MSERKVLNKYFPPDFDPAIPRRKQPKDAQHKVRLMTPYAMRCETCGDYIYKGKKFNARKETVEGESYHSIKIFRFYIKCPRCSAEITFKTDPKNTDYVAEHGASRNFEPWREEKIADVESKLQKEKEEENNPMKALENRTMDSKREMDILDALDEIRTRNARNERVDANELLDKLVEEEEVTSKTEQEILEEQDEQLAKSIFNTDHTKKIINEEQHMKNLLSEARKSLILPTFGTNKPGSTRNTTGSIFDSNRNNNIITKRKSSSSDLGIIVKKRKPET
ncbi:5267_t:CDS:2 [Entrophospora sp. SA101]|nr:102_t:CDS:2 [Entrophospora candida]CAH1756568.1 3634_t:CDS:2 [Entrophospora sp. SA101]CAG8596369.1 4620_t:CDS:2 [Entrophospora candida]CAJ0635299.1 15285_t:CDS:2 [Entrophospora sp. SA101]CAJ0747325.1 5267_t:CDS:2 [Entrophospora sp. SA101]